MTSALSRADSVCPRYPGRRWRYKGRAATRTDAGPGRLRPAQHIDGKAAYTGEAGRRGPLKVAGRIEMEQKAKGRGLTPPCKALLTRRH